MFVICGIFVTSQGKAFSLWWPRGITRLQQNPVCQLSSLNKPITQSQKQHICICMCNTHFVCTHVYIWHKDIAFFRFTVTTRCPSTWMAHMAEWVMIPDMTSIDIDIHGKYSHASMTKNRLMVAFDSNKGPNLKVVKWCWKGWNGPILMHIYDKQCEIIQKNQWKNSNFQIQCFYKGTSGAPCWKRRKTQKLGKLKHPLLNFFKW